MLVGSNTSWNIFDFGFVNSEQPLLQGIVRELDVRLILDVPGQPLIGCVAVTLSLFEGGERTSVADDPASKRVRPPCSPHDRSHEWCTIE